VSQLLLEDLIRLETAVWQALADGDAAADGRLLSDDFLGVYPTGFADRKSHMEQLIDGPTVASFALHDATNSYVFGDDTARLGLDLGTVEGQRRIRFGLGPIPVTGGKYWITLGVHSRDNARVYHVQDERYSFEVQQAEGRRDQLSIPVTVRMEDL